MNVSSFTPPRGGRGKKAPYMTTHYRIPIAIKKQVEWMANNYKQMVIEGKIKPDAEYDPRLKEGYIYVRVPKEIKLEIEKYVEEHENLVNAGLIDRNISTTKQIKAMMLASKGYGSAVMAARDILAKGESVETSLILLLTALYELDVDPEFFR